MTETAPKADYPALRQLLRALIDGETEPIPNLANASALIWQTLPAINWAGFYLNTGAELLLGPFQGKPACIRIPYTRGVCGAAVRENRTQRIRDVHAFPGHIACDGASLSELVVPIRAEGKIVAVLDVDSPTANRFDEEDQQGMEALAELLAQGCDWTRAALYWAQKPGPEKGAPES